MLTVLKEKFVCFLSNVSGTEIRGNSTYLEDRGPKGVRKQDTPLCLRFLNACSTSLASEAGSIRQKEPFPGSSWERGTLIK